MSIIISLHGPHPVGDVHSYMGEILAYCIVVSSPNLYFYFHMFPKNIAKTQHPDLIVVSTTIKLKNNL